MLELSLIFPCYNEAEHIESSVRTVVQMLEHSNYSYEVVFVDDGSKDNTRELLKQICQRYSNCRYIFHEKNKGRGGAFKTGFAATSGAVSGFIDIDLEVGAHYILPLVALIENEGVDVATGLRHYELSQVKAFHRHVLSHGYRFLTRNLLGLNIKDSETGCKFFKRSTATAVIFECDSDGWFWDTEVMARSVLSGLKIREMPVLFFRRMDKTSTVKIIPDTFAYMKELIKFRRSVGVSYLSKSPIYWSPKLYDTAMALVCGAEYDDYLQMVANVIPNGAEVVDVCCGSSALYKKYLKQKHCNYLGLDFNAHFVHASQRAGINAMPFNLLTDKVPTADYVTISSSFYHFRNHQDEILEKLINAARKKLIISEPISNLSQSKFPLLGKFSNALTNPGVGDYSYRYTPEEFEDFVEANGASEYRTTLSKKNAIAIFDGKA